MSRPTQFPFVISNSLSFYKSWWWHWSRRRRDAPRTRLQTRRSLLRCPTPLHVFPLHSSFQRVSSSSFSFAAFAVMPPFKGVPQKRGILSFFRSASKPDSLDAPPPPPKKPKEAKDNSILPTTLLAPLSVDNVSPASAPSPKLSPDSDAPPLTRSISAPTFNTGDKEFEEDDFKSDLLALSMDNASRSTAIQPLARLPAYSYVCPFKEDGLCKRSDTFKDFHALASHCAHKHPGMIKSPIESDPLEDGTEKIPCQLGCGKMFATYELAHSHAIAQRKGKCFDLRASFYPRACPWPGCVADKAIDSRSYVTHAGAHKDDANAPYQCSQCDRFFIDLYFLASHEKDCSKRSPRFDGVLTAAMASDGEDESRPTMVIIARASSHAPKVWYAERFCCQGG
ncbi:hypothetical protein BKA63DRAFT_600884 [Paraphoma chrysanthemicola]|nr:hypothetical protein BKA63DRAFT_600884 [Paraphoma chrysanthemicola]